MTPSPQIYTSVADPVLRFDDYRNLVTRASRFNAMSNITGLLVMSRLRFVQVLEGEAVHIKPLFQRIQKDPRHHKVELVEFCSNNVRRFSEWGMRLVYLEELDCFEQWNHVFDHSKHGPQYTYPSQDYLSMLECVRRELMDKYSTPSASATS